MTDPLFPDPPATSSEVHAGTTFEPLLCLLAAVSAPLRQTTLLELVRRVELAPPDARAWTPEALGLALNRLQQRGRVSALATGVQCAPAYRFAAFREAALGPYLQRWAEPLLETLFGGDGKFRWGMRQVSSDETVGILRIALCGRLTAKRSREALEALGGNLYPMVWQTAFAQPFEAAIVELIEPTLRHFTIERLLAVALHRPTPSAAELVRWAAAQPLARSSHPALRYRTVEHLQWRGEFAAAHVLLGAERSGVALGLLAASQAMQGDAPGALEMFAASDAALKREGLKPRGALPLPVAWFRCAALLASDDALQCEAARKLCRAEARKSGDPGSLWYLFERVAACRLGEQRGADVPLPGFGYDALSDLLSAKALLLLDRRPDKAGRAALQRVATQFADSGYAWAAAEMNAALAIFSGEQSNPTAWRRALNAMRALGADAAVGETSASDLRHGWVVQTNDGYLRVEACEQKRGPRGWGRNRIVPLARVLRSERLDPRDTEVCRGVLHAGGHSGWLDPDRALPALVGHPRVYFAPDLETPVELAESAPVIEVVRTPKGARLRLDPAVREAMSELRHDSPSGKADPVRLWRESPTRVHVVRLTATRRRLAQLIGKGLDVPAEGLGELDTALQQAAGSFEIHSNLDAEVDDVVAERLLLAELSPLGSGLRLRLAIRPLGNAGPRFLPGAGASRVIAAVGAKRLAAVRDLDAERAAVAALIERTRLPEDVAGGFEWVVEEPTRCLALVETLQALPDLVRTEWPAGKPLRVTRAHQIGDLRVSVAGGRDWFVASGGVALDDGTVVQLQRLIELAREHAGRFLPLGDGGFLALGEDLRRRVDELARLAEHEADGMRFPLLADAAVAESLDGAVVHDVQDWWQARREQFEAARSLTPVVPSTLQAELRPYQLEGFRWLVRVAACGAGACLADDMGLGKTVQALAVLLQRAAGGPALIVAPTSVVPNWLQEAQRFAPTLQVREFQGAERAALVNTAGPFDVLIGSYTLVQQTIESFGGRVWHTVILDEAQQVKNATTKRAQAVLALEADFRIATTGTPVENRLDELWMLFRFLNPGLLGSRERFAERFVAPIERRGDAQARAQLRRLVRPFVLRRIKSQVLPDLPPRTEITLTVKPEPAEAAFHEALRRSALETIAREDLPAAQRRFRVLAELMRLRRACCDPAIVVPGTDLRGAKLETFAELASELAANRHKALVFSQFTAFLERLRERLDGLGLRYQYLDGSTPAAERTRRIAAFQAGEGDFFLISLKAGGFGLNLTAADYVILADPWWNPAVEDQAAARAWRLGQGRPVTVYRLVLAGSIEERIVAMHHDKRALAEGLFGGEEFGSALSAEQMVDLMREAVAGGEDRGDGAARAAPPPAGLPAAAAARAAPRSRRARD